MVNRVVPSPHEWSLEITLTVPLRLVRFCVLKHVKTNSYSFCLAVETWDEWTLLPLRMSFLQYMWENILLGGSPWSSPQTNPRISSSKVLRSHIHSFLSSLAEVEYQVYSYTQSYSRDSVYTSRGRISSSIVLHSLIHGILSIRTSRGRISRSIVLHSLIHGILAILAEVEYQVV